VGDQQSRALDSYSLLHSYVFNVNKWSFGLKISSILDIFFC
jgi:hypothetical protein